MKFEKKEPTESSSKQERDLTYGRLFFEQRFYLNRSGTKWVSIGVKPLMNGQFTRVLRIVDRNGLFLTFTPGQVGELFILLSEVPALRNYSNKNSYDEEEEESEFEFNPGAINIEESEFNNHVFVIENGTSEEKVTYISMGLKSLQRLCELEDLIYFAYKNLDYVIAKGVFYDLVDDVKHMSGKDRRIDNVRKFLINKAYDRFDFDEFNPRYLITRDTLAKFEDYFHFIVNKDD